MAIRHPWQQIEEEVLYAFNPPNLRAIAAHYSIPYSQVKNRSSKYQWTQKWNENREVRERAAHTKKIEALYKTYAQVDEAILRVAQLALIHAQKAFYAVGSEKHSQNEFAKPRDIKQLIEAANTAQVILSRCRGDAGEALTSLVNAELIPEEIVPELLENLAYSQDILQENIRQTFKKLPAIDCQSESI